MALKRFWKAVAVFIAVFAGLPAEARPAPAAPEIDWFGVYSERGMSYCAPLLTAGLPKFGYQVVSTAGNGTPGVTSARDVTMIVARHATQPYSLTIFCGFATVGVISGPADARAARLAERERLKKALQSELTRFRPDPGVAPAGTSAAPRLAPLLVATRHDGCVQGAEAALGESGYVDIRYEDGKVRASHGSRPIVATMLCGLVDDAYLVLATGPTERVDLAAEARRLAPVMTARAEAEFLAIRAREAAEVTRKSEAACTLLEASGGAPKVEWAWLNLVHERGFSILFPTYPCITEGTGPRGPETLFTAVADGVSYTLSIADPGAGKLGAPEAVLDAELETLQREGATVISAKRTPLGSNPGSIVWISRPLPNGTQARATLRYVVHKDRLYRMAVAYAPGRDVAADMQRFGDSLKFVDLPPTRKKP
jgi:hypothetical protein